MSEKKNLIENLIFFKKEPEMLGYFDMSKFNLSFRKELNFCYYNLNIRYRQKFRNVFLIFELSTIISIIRHALSDNMVEIEKIHQDSLLSDQIKAIMIKNSKFLNRLFDLCRYLSVLNRAFLTLPEVFLKKEMRVFEEGFSKAYFEGLLTDKKNISEIREFIRIFIDLYNINALYKKTVWESHETVNLIDGGSLSEIQIKEKLKNADFKPISYLRDQATRIKQRGISSEIYHFLHYLLLLYLENINLNILINTLDYERDYVESAII